MKTYPEKSNSSSTTMEISYRIYRLYLKTNVSKNLYKLYEMHVKYPH